MRGVSEVIAIILILMITISLAGLAYMFMSTTMSDVTSSAGSTVDATTNSMLTSFTIESMDVAKVYVRNTGQNTLTSISVYVNDEPAIYNVTTPIAAGAVGTVTIYSFIPDGATIKITSPNGFSTSKVAHPCERAVGCWKFDEASGTMAYDSSSYGHTGTLTNGPTWTSGSYGGALTFDGANDYVDVGDAVLGANEDFTINILARFPNNYSTTRHFFSRGQDGSGSGWSVFFTRRSDQKVDFSIVPTSPTESQYTVTSSAVLLPNTWYHVSGVFVQNSNITVYVNGIFSGSVAVPKTSLRTSTKGVLINGVPVTSVSSSNATIDEVRIYNRAIY